jgi:hypothetical protein
MATDLGRPFPADWRGRPPHMSTNDRAIWTHFYPTIESQVQALYFDVALGPGPPIPPKTPPNLARMWTRLNQKRVDVVVDLMDRVAIIETRYNASSSAIGRLLMYKRLWLLDPPLPQPVETWIVTNAADPDWLPLATELGIKTFTVPDAL